MFFILVTVYKIHLKSENGIIVLYQNLFLIFYGVDCRQFHNICIATKDQKYNEDIERLYPLITSKLVHHWPSVLIIPESKYVVNKSDVGNTHIYKSMFRSRKSHSSS